MINKIQLTIISHYTCTYNTCIHKISYEDEIVNNIRRIFQEEFEVHERKINDMIKSNMELADNRLHKISIEVFEITKSLEFTQNKLERELKPVKKNITKIKSEMKEFTEDLLDLNLASDKLIELEDTSRRNNLRIDGITEQPNETWKEYMELNKNKLNMENVTDIDRCRRMSKHKDHRPRAIIFRLNKFKDKQKILRNPKKFKGTKIYIYEDFCDNKGSKEIFVG